MERKGDKKKAQSFMLIDSILTDLRANNLSKKTCSSSFKAQAEKKKENETLSDTRKKYIANCLSLISKNCKKNVKEIKIK